MSITQETALMGMLKRLVACSSITGTREEVLAEQEILDILSHQDYFKANPSHFLYYPIPNDPCDRSAVIALLKGKGDKTVILLSHHDTVDTKDYGPYQKHALNPDSLISSLQNASLDAGTKSDLQSGDWIFGRGVMDMKAGIALSLHLVDNLGQRACDLQGNILFVSVPDEETNSAGMLGAVPYLLKLSSKYHLDYTGLVNTEPSSFNHDGTYNLYTGSVGKLLPMILCFGKESHAMEPFKGLSSNLMMADLIKTIEGNPLLCDSLDGEFTIPPSNLKASDMTDAYSVSLPSLSYCYFNLLTCRRNPEETLGLIMDMARTSFVRTIDGISQRIKEYTKTTGLYIDEPDWKPRVMTYRELYDMCVKEHGPSFETHMKDFLEKQQKQNPDERQLTAKVMAHVHSFCPDRAPKMVVGFAPPFYPSITIKGGTDKETHTLKCIEKLKEYSYNEFGIKLKPNKFFNGISDLSYCGLQYPTDVAESFAANMPNWGHPYSIPLAEIRKLDVPGIILGPWGKDLHKFTERLNRKFFLDIAPKLLKFYVYTLLGVDTQ